MNLTKHRYAVLIIKSFKLEMAYAFDTDIKTSKARPDKETRICLVVDEFDVVGCQGESSIFGAPISVSLHSELGLWEKGLRDGRDGCAFYIYLLDFALANVTMFPVTCLKEGKRLSRQTRNRPPLVHLRSLDKITTQTEGEPAVQSLRSPNPTRGSSLRRRSG